MNPEAVIARVLGVDPDMITDAASNTSLPGWDSFAHITLVLELESEYGVGFSVEESIEIKDVGSIKRMLESKGVRW